eukprot:465291-Rhodomonas_salina.1
MLVSTKATTSNHSIPRSKSLSTCLLLPANIQPSTLFRLGVILKSAVSKGLGEQAVSKLH